MIDLVPIKRALISVSDKTDLVPFARKLSDLGVTIISTGGTAKKLEEAGLKVTTIDQVTGFPEMMDGRVKTLHPRVHGGLLGLRDEPSHVAAMKEHGIEPIDLVCVNLYPFEQTVSKEGVAEHEAIEQIDIGGPSMIRSASKNFRSVTVVTDPKQYDQIVSELDRTKGATTFALRRRLALAAFARTAAYDTAIAEWMAGTSTAAFPASKLIRLERAMELRYGENPHQQAALYVDPRATEPSVAAARQLHGKELSFNNLYDANGALELVKEIDPAERCAAAVIKHANPCGFAIAASPAEAFTNAYAGDPLAAFGGIVALNQTIDLSAAQAIVEGKKFLEVIIAPAYDKDALALLKERWANVRILETGPLPAPAQRDPAEYDAKRITGGLLIQSRDLAPFDLSEWKHAAGPAPSDADLLQLRVAMTAVKHIKSNAVCLVRDNALVGAGAGQMDRVASCRIAIEKAGERAKGAYVGSDAFFPFRDGPDLLIAAGVKAIAQPGGSKKDDETIAACNESGTTLILTGRRHFRH
ncbi:MAG: bifunctional phosphoribosylaminoimidazolecarboxamide formyltransferase/IMP cyclohydrolase [Planctomycetes bacterium]|nr:bifunctional phosphoribosylaminoimidazolecarboxamide formyltransferase/IMP cyclohydrolase [Planctomycetota bacterium]